MKRVSFVFLFLLIAVLYHFTVYAETATKTDTGVQSDTAVKTDTTAKTDTAVVKDIPAPKVVPSGEDFKKNITDLINKRRELSLQIYQARVDLINSDPNLRIIHQAIMDLNQKMADELNANPRIIALTDKGNEIDKEIAAAINNYQKNIAEGSKQQ